jgi:hypothetical protein
LWRDGLFSTKLIPEKKKENREAGNSMKIIIMGIKKKDRKWKIKIKKSRKSVDIDSDANNWHHIS